jgi:hypothetical protein
MGAVMGEIIEIKDADGNIVRISMFSALNQIAAHIGKTLERGSTVGVEHEGVRIEITTLLK